MKSIFVGIAALGLAQAAGIHSTKASDDDDHLRLITGAINADGTSQFTTNAFTSTRLGPGHYLIKFAPQVFG